MSRIDKIFSLVEMVSSIFHLKPKKVKDDKEEKAKMVAEQVRIGKEGMIRYSKTLRDLSKK